jgi:hypothetical protein
MNLGAEPKKIALLGILLVAAVYVLFFNPFSDTPANSAQTSTPAPTTPRPSPSVPVGTPAANPASVPGYQAPPAVNPLSTRKVASGKERTLQEFRPSLKPKKDEARLDPTTADPTLKLDIITKLQKVKLEGTHRSLFEFGAAPPDPQKLIASSKGPVPSPFAGRPWGIGPEPPPKKVEPTPPAPPPPPPPPPFKFFGYINASNQVVPKRAFFLEGDEIHVVGEGDVVKRRYRIVRIGVNSVVVEDTDNHHQSTLPLEEAPG